MITLVLYIGSIPNLATWFPYGRRGTLFILGSLPLYRLIIYIDGRILWFTHFLFLFKYQLNCSDKSIAKLHFHIIKVCTIKKVIEKNLLKKSVLKRFNNVIWHIACIVV